jgi:hypothetical protein
MQLIAQGIGCHAPCWARAGLGNGTPLKALRIRLRSSGGASLIPPAPSCHDGPDRLHQAERPSSLKKSVHRSHRTRHCKQEYKPRTPFLQRVTDEHCRNRKESKKCERVHENVSHPLPRQPPSWLQVPGPLKLTNPQEKILFPLERTWRWTIHRWGIAQRERPFFGGVAYSRGGRFVDRWVSRCAFNNLDFRSVRLPSF